MWPLVKEEKEMHLCLELAVFSSVLCPIKVATLSLGLQKTDSVLGCCLDPETGEWLWPSGSQPSDLLLIRLDEGNGIVQRGIHGAHQGLLWAPPTPSHTCYPPLLFIQKKYLYSYLTYRN